MPPSPEPASRPTAPSELFISYARPDRARAEALHRRLEAAGFAVWFDQARLQHGDAWQHEITARSDAARLVLPVLTPHWHQSKWTKYETYGARAVLPLVAEGSPADMLPPPLLGLHAPAFDPLTTDEAGWQALFSAIRRELARTPREPLPVFQQLPHDPNRWFTGREAEMNLLHEALHPGPAPNPDSLAWAITGLGGLGKTTLANEYARRFRRLYPRILWVWGDRDYAPQFAALHDKVVGTPAPAGMSEADKATRVMEVLRGDEARLLVLDNVTDPAAADAWIPRSGGCRTLITARVRHFPPANRTIELLDLTPEASRAFLSARTSRSAEGAESAACDRLVEHLGGLPLALEQAAAYIAEQKIGFTKYLREYEAEAGRLLAEPVPGFTHYPESVVTTWRVTLKNLSREARAVLRLCSALGSAPIALQMFIDGAQAVAVLGDTLAELRPRPLWLRWAGRRDTAPARAPRTPDRKAAQRAVRDAVVKGLHRYSMIQDWDGESFRVHTLVRDVEWLAMDKGAQRYACGLLTRMLETHAPADPRDATERDACDAALVHGAALWQRLKAAGLNWPDEKLPGVLYECAAARGAVAAAEDYAMAHYEEAKRHRGPISEVTRRAAERVANSLYDRGEYARALPIFQVILHTHETQDGPEHPATLTSVNNLAGCIRALGDAAGALPLFRRALEGCERVFGKAHSNTLASVNNLGGCMWALGDAAGALPLFRRALEGCEGMLGKEHPDTISSMNNLALCLYALGDVAGALPLFRLALDSHERALGKEHPDTLTSVNNLALCLYALGDAAGALPLFRRALDSRERALGKEHPDTLTSVNNLAGCLRALGDAAGALLLFRRALDGFERVLGKEHPETLTSVGNLAGCMRALGDAAGALPLHRRALDGFERVLGKEHPDTLMGLGNLAECLRVLGDAAGALPFYRHALDGFERVLGKEHPDTLTTVNNLAVCLEALGDAAGALPLYRRALESRERVLGKEHPNTLTSVNNLADTMQTLGDAAVALPLYCRALEGSERVLGPEHPQTRTIAANLASLLAATADPAGTQPAKPEQTGWALGATLLTAPPVSAGIGYRFDLAGLLALVAEPAPASPHPRTKG